VPSLWRLEVANSLTAVRQKRITQEFRNQSLADLARLRIRLDPDTAAHAWDATLKLADQYKLTTYDAAYLELAQRLALRLATLDQDLRRAARNAGVPLRGDHKEVD
jgi:predicted nucleic acid-binding protein